MCGRFTLRSNPRDFAHFFQRDLLGDWQPRFNIAPTQPVAVIRQFAGQGELVPLVWGLIPAWSKGARSAYRMINARCETVAEKPSFRSAFQCRRCLVLADGYYEWKKLGRLKQPYLIRMADDTPFAFAGLWETWPGPKNEPLSTPLQTCTIVTTNSNRLTAEIHDRMPVILNPDDYSLWLDAQFDGKEQLKAMLRPFSSEELTMYAVRPLVNKPGNDVPECIERIDA